MGHICFQHPLGRVDRGRLFILVLIVSLNSLGDKSLKTGSDSVGRNSLLTTNPDDTVKLTGSVLSDSLEDVGETMGGSVVDGHQ